MKRIMLFFIVWLMSACAPTGEPFTEQGWKDAADSERYRYVEDLLSGKTIEGKTKDEIKSMLGVPSYQGEDYWTYVISKEQRGFSTIKLLQIDFEEDVSKSAFVRSD